MTNHDYRYRCVLLPVHMSVCVYACNLFYFNIIIIIITVPITVLFSICVFLILYACLSSSSSLAKFSLTIGIKLFTKRFLTVCAIGPVYFGFDDDDFLVSPYGYLSIFIRKHYEKQFLLNPFFPPLKKIFFLSNSSELVPLFYLLHPIMDSFINYCQINLAYLKMFFFQLKMIIKTNLAHHCWCTVWQKYFHHHHHHFHHLLLLLFFNS